MRLRRRTRGERAVVRIERAARRSLRRSGYEVLSTLPLEPYGFVLRLEFLDPARPSEVRHARVSALAEGSGLASLGTRGRTRLAEDDLPHGPALDFPVRRLGRTARGRPSTGGRPSNKEYARLVAEWAGPDVWSAYSDSRSRGVLGVPGPFELGGLREPTAREARVLTGFLADLDAGVPRAWGLRHVGDPPE